jgi:hypothetical protein
MTGPISEPLLHATPIADLRPTQFTVGMREVSAKRKAWRDRKSGEFEKFLAAHMVPVILGPGGKRYLIDHHHLALALSLEKLPSVFVYVVADLGKIADAGTFWNMMEFHGWTHPYDSKGRRRDYADLPKTVDQLKDDPYRSLAGELRTHGGFAKSALPFSEFVWADFLRGQIEAKAVEEDFDAALAKALALAKTDDASYLPGWCAPRGKKAKKA